MSVGLPMKATPKMKRPIEMSTARMRIPVV
jgi:hypothetical protein